MRSPGHPRMLRMHKVGIARLGTFERHGKTVNVTRHADPSGETFGPYLISMMPGITCCNATIDSNKDCFSSAVIAAFSRISTAVQDHMASSQTTLPANIEREASAGQQ